MTRTILPGLLILLCLPRFIEAGQVAAADRPAVPDLVSEETVAVSRIDLNKLDVAAWYRWPLEAAEMPDLEIPQEQENIAAVRTLRDAGAEALFLFFDLTDIPNEVSYVAVPLTPGADADAIGEVVQRRLSLEEVRTIRGAVVGGTRERLERLESEEPVAADRFITALAATEPRAIQFAFALSDTQRRAIEELVFPTLPQQLGGGPSSTLTRGILWASVAVDGPPQLSLHVVIQSEDARRAQQLNDWLDQVVFARLLADPQVNQLLPNAAEIVAMFRPQLQDDRLVLDVDHRRLMPAAGEAIRAVAHRVPTEEEQSMNNLKLIALAMHNYHDTFRRFPSPAISDDHGKPLLSWRVKLLPYIGQRELYEQFRLDEPWDSEHNRELISQMPDTYHSPASDLPRESGRTTYLLPVLEGGVFEEQKGHALGDITDSIPNTLMMIEAGDLQSVIWTKPDDWTVDPSDPTATLSGQHPDRFYAATCDGAVRPFRLPIDPDSLLIMLRRADGRPIDVSQLSDPVR